MLSMMKVTLKRFKDHDINCKQVKGFLVGCMIELAKIAAIVSHNVKLLVKIGSGSQDC